MDLYSYVSIESFVRGCKESKTPGTFTLHVPNLLYAKSDEVIGYGLSLLRRSIVLHEEQKGIGPELSKQNIPFFRENRRMLIGPEVEMYALSLYQNLEIPSGVKEKDTSCLRLTFDYGALGDPVEAGYDFIGANLVPYVDYAIPFGCLRRIALMNLSENSLTYSALAGFLQSIGLAPDRYLEGMLEE